MIVAQITDLHIKRRGHFLHHMPHVAQPLRKALNAIERWPQRPACIVATGDLTESGSPEEYRRLRELLEPFGVPIYLVPGNHDNRDAIRKAFPDRAYLHEFEPAIQFTVEFRALRVIALDTSQGRRRGGYLDKTRLAWLTDRLAERPLTPTILAMHHPPFPTGVPNFDGQQFEGRDALGAIVREHPQICRVIGGHVHQPLVRPWCGTVGVTAPSTAPTLVLHPRAPGLSWEPGGFLLHRYDADAGLTTELVRTLTQSSRASIPSAVSETLPYS
ncbi:MAG TPA: phosphodiesterase [Candidatus Baltobacteraceae bacterium]|nr:phosphodiesterase [Candidatus Baltobacteraceae bacterium]